MPREVTYEIERRVEVLVVVPDDMTDDEVRTVLREQGDDLLEPRAYHGRGHPDVRKLSGKTITMDEAVARHGKGDSYRMSDSREQVLDDEVIVDWIENSLTARLARFKAAKLTEPIEPQPALVPQGGCGNCEFGRSICTRFEAAGAPAAGTDAMLAARIVAWLETSALTGCPGWRPREPRSTTEPIPLTVPDLAMVCDHVGKNEYHCAECCPGNCNMHAKRGGSAARSSVGFAPGQPHPSYPPGVVHCILCRHADPADHHCEECCPPNCIGRVRAGGSAARSQNGPTSDGL